jgi:gliding motility-associated-like protein
VKTTLKDIFFYLYRSIGFCAVIFFVMFFSGQVYANCPNINSSFTTSQLVICGPGPNTISFVNTSTGPGAAAANYSWYLNGSLFSTTSGLAAPSTSNISALGTYTYMVVAQDTGTLCLDTAIVTVVIRPIPVSSYTFTPNNQCAGTTVNFTNTSTGTGGFTTYQWNFGDAGTSTAISPSHVYANGGSYNVTLTVTNGAGCVSTSTQTVTVLPRPNVNIAGDDGDGNTVYCLAPIDTATVDPVTFFNFTTGAVSYSWNFGDGSPIFNTASTASFVHNYTSYGTYTVTMTATGANGCTNSATLTVVFDKFVAASFSVPLAQFSGCAPHTVTPVNASQNADLYVWNFGDGSPPVTTTSFIPPSHTYTTGGSYTISLVASNSCNTSNSTVGPITIVGAPVINFSMSPNPGCAPQMVSFGNTTTGASPTNNFYWDFGNGNTLNGVKFPPPQLYSNSGTYTIMLISGNACGTDTLYHTLVIDTIPHSVITVNPTIGCTPLTVTTTNTSTGGALTYQWFIDGVLTYTSLNIPNQVFTAPAGNAAVNHTIRLRASNHCGFDDSLVTITVHPQVVAILNPVNSTICAGASVNFTQTSQGTSLTYSWNFGNGNTSTSANPPAQAYPTPGTYNVSLIVNGFCGADTAFGTVVVNAIPAAPTALGATICAGNSTILTATAPGGTYQWYNAPVAGTLLFTGPSYTTPILGATTTYYVQSTIAGCTGPRTPVTVIVNPVPAAPTALGTTICAGNTATLTATAPGGPYQWYNAPVGGVLLFTGASFTTPILVTNTTYYVQSTLGGCTSARTAVTVIVNPIPAAPTAASTTICSGGSVTLNATAPGGTYQWYDLPAAGTLLFTGPSYTTPVLTNTTTYYVQTTVAGCTSARTAVTVTVNPYPIADFTPSITSGCAGLIVNFNDNSTLGATYAWTFAGGAPASSAIYTPPPVSFNTAGIHMVHLVVNLAGCISHDTAFIDIAPLPTPSFTVTPNTGCAPVLSTINNTSGVTIGDTYAWNFGNGNTSILQNPGSINYTNTSNTTDSIYTIKLVITAANGCKDSVTHTVTVHPIPVAAFTPNTDTICANNSIVFSNNSIGATTYAWNFGDAGTSALTNPSHLYTTPNHFIVRLIATSAFGCKDTVFQTMVVDSVPVAGFNHTTECMGFTTLFTNTSTGGITTWNYNFGDGGPNGSTPGPSHLYATNGTYNVVLTVTNTFGCTNSITHPVIVNPVPVANFNNSTACFGQATTFTDLTTGTPIGWNWNFGDASPTSNAQNPSHTYTAAGSYVVTLIAFGGAGCSDTIQHTVTVNPVPSANFIFTSVCSADTTFFTSTSGGAPNTFTWNFGDGNTDNTNNAAPSHIYATANTYNVTLTAGYALTGCTNSTTLAVVSYPHTVPNFASNTPCLNAATNFNDLTTNAPTLWTWDFGDGSANNLTQNPAHTYLVPGTYPVQLTTENIFGCIDSVTLNAIIHPLPVAAFSFDTVCLNSTTTFIDQSTSAVGWSWNFGDAGTSASNSPTHTYATAGTFNVRLIVTNIFGCVDTVFHNIIVHPNPVSAYTATTACHTYPTSFTDNSTAAVAWSWDYGDLSPLDPTQSPTHIYANPGNYNVTLVVTNVFGCTNSSNQMVTVLPQPVANFTFSTVCAGQIVQFNDQTVGASMTNWTWDFGDGSPVNNLQNPMHVYTAGGNYNTMLISQNSAGCADTVILAVVVHSVPVPLFTANTTCQGNITSFTDQSTDVVAITNWFYDFADGNNSLSQNPNYIFLAPGIYNVSLTVTNINGCDSTFIMPVTVNIVPNATYTSDTVCIGSATTFTDLSTGLPNSWQWDFGDGVTDTVGPVTSHTYAFSGSYLSTLTVSNGPGCSDQAFHVVTVIADAIAGINTPNAACLNSTVNLNDASTITSGFIVNSTWDFGDGSAIVTALNTTHIYTTTGTYYITHVVTSNGGCSSTDIDTIIINPLPVAAFTTANTCQVQPSNFTDQSTGGPVTWTWDFGDSFTSGVQNPTHNYTNFGSYNVGLIIADANGCGDTVINPVTVYGQPTAAFTNSVVCWGDTTQFNNTSFTPDGTIINTQWDFGDGNNSALYSPDHVFQTLNDSFTVSLIITTDLGCIDTVTQITTTIPIPAFNFGPTLASGCENFTTAFHDLTTVPGGTIVNWLWDFGDSNYTYTANPAHTYYDPGSYTVILTVTSSYGCTMTDTLNYPVVVYPAPVAQFTADPLFSTSIFEPDMNFIDQSINTTAWDWDFGDNNSDIVQNPTHTYHDTGTYVVTLIAFNAFGCTDTIQHIANIFGQTTIFIPNAFTPNGTELNEIWRPIMHGFKEYKCAVFNKWGEEIFYTEDQLTGWNGTYKNEGESPVQQDVYVYRIFVVDLMDTAFTYVGSITLLR